jgi:hypothetical protein
MAPVGALNSWAVIARDPRELDLDAAGPQKAHVL